MNVTVYVFSKLNGKYSQYPDDYTRELFDKFQSLSEAGAKMVIHRDGELMYYGYVRQKTGTEDYVGFCILLNGVMLTRIEPLAAVFEKAFDEAVAGFSMKNAAAIGLQTAVVEKAYDMAVAGFFVRVAERVSAQIKEAVAQMECEALPPVAYGISSDEKAVFADARNNDVIVRAAAKYPYVVVENGGAGSESAGMDAPGVLVAAGQKTQEKKGKRGKDGMSDASSVAIAGVVAFFIIFLFIGIPIMVTRSRNRTVSESSEFKDLKNMVGSYVPIIITKVEVANVDGDGVIETNYGDAIFSSNSMYLKPKIYYRAVEKTPMNIALKVKLYDPSGELVLGRPSPSDESYSYAVDAEIPFDESSVELDGWGSAWKGNYEHGYYRFEFWYGDMCLGSKRFYIW